MAELYFKVSADYEEVKKLRQEISLLEGQMKSAKFSDPIDAWSKSLSEAKKRLDSIVTSAAQAGRTLQQSLSSLGSSNPFGGLSSGARDTQNALNGLNSSLGSTSNAMKDLGDASVNVNMSNFVKNSIMAKGAIEGIGLAIAKIKQSIGTIFDFQSANATLGAITGATGEEMASLQQKALDLGRTTRFTASQVTQLETEFAKLGFPTDDILNMSRATLDFAQSTGADLANAATTAGAALKMFGAESTETKRYVAAMSAATRMSALDFSAISNNLATFGPMAKSMGMEIEDVLALFGKLRDQGIEASTAMTSLRNIFTKVSQGKIEGMGKVNNLDEFIASLQRVQDSLGGDVGKAMKMIGPRGGTQFMSLISAFNAKEVDETTGQMVDSITALRNKIREAGQDTSLDEMANKMDNNVQGAIARLGSAWEGFVLSFSGINEPTAQILDTMGEGINKVTDMLTSGTGKIDPAVFSAIAEGVAAIAASYATYKGGLEAAQVWEIAHSKYLDMLPNTYEAVASALENATQARGVSLAQLAEEAGLRGELTYEQAQEISNDLEEAVAKGKLTQERASEIFALRESAQARMNEIDAFMEQTEGAEELYKGMEKLYDEELEGVNVTIESLEAQLAAASAENKDTIATQLNEAATRKATLTENKNEAAVLANSVATQREAAANEKDAIAKSMNTKASWSLNGVLKALNLTFLTSPWFWVAAAIGGVAAVMYHLWQKTDIETQAQEHLNEVLDEQNKRLGESVQKGNEYTRTMKDNTKTAWERYEAYKALIDLYGQEFQKSDGTAMSMSDIAAMDDKEIQARINKGKERQQRTELDQRKNIYQELASIGGQVKTVDGKTKTYKQYSIREKDVRNVLEKNGVTDKEQIDAYLKELNDIDWTDNDSDYYKQSLKELNDQLKEMAGNQAAARISSSLTKMGEMSATNFQQSATYAKKLTEVLGGLNAENFSANKGLLLDQLTKGADAANERIKALNEELLTTTDPKKKNEILLSLKDENNAKEMVDSIIEMLQNGATIEEVIKVRTELENNSVDISDEEAAKLAKPYLEAKKGVSDYVGVIEKAKAEHKTLEEAAKEMGVNVEQSQKAVEKSANDAKKEVERLRNELKLVEEGKKKVTAKEKLQIEADLKGAEQCLKDVEMLKKNLKDAFKNKFHLQVLVDFLTGKTKDEAEDDKKQKGDKKTVNGKEYTKGEDGKYHRKDENGVDHKLVYKDSKGSSASKQMDNIVNKAAQQTQSEDGSGGKQLTDKAKEMASANDKLKSQQNAYYDAMAKDVITQENMVSNAEINGIVQGKARALLAMQQKHKEELQKLDQQRKDRIKQIENQAKALFDAEQAVNKAKGGKEQKWNDLTAEQKADYSNTQAYDAYVKRMKDQGKEAMSFDTFKTSHSGVLSSTNGQLGLGAKDTSNFYLLEDATKRKQQNEVNDFVGYQAEQEKKKAEARKFYDDIAALEREKKNLQELARKTDIQEEKDAYYQRYLQIEQYVKNAKNELGKLQSENGSQRVNDFFMKYGTTTQQREATARDYKAKEQRALNNGDVMGAATIRKEAKQKDSEFAFKEQKEQLDMAKGMMGVKGMEDVIKKTLEGLANFMDSGDYNNLSADQKQELRTTQQQLQSQVGDKGLGSNIRGLRDSKVNYDNAMTGLKQELERRDQLIEQSKQVNQKLTEALAKLVDLEGSGASQEEIDSAQAEVDKAQAESDKFNEQMEECATNIHDFSEDVREASEESNKFAGKLTSGVGIAVNGLKKLGDADSLSEIWGGVTDVIGQFMSAKDGGVADATQAMGKAGGYIGAAFSLADMINKDGLGSIIDNISDTIVGAISGITESFMDPEFWMSLLESAVDMLFAPFTAIFDKGNMAEMTEAIDGLKAENEDLAKAIDRLSQELSESGPQQAAATYEKLIAKNNEQMSNYQTMMSDTVRARDSGSHTLDYYWNDKNGDLLSKIGSAMGKSFSSLNDLVSNASAEMWQQLQTDNPELYTQFKNSIHDIESNEDGVMEGLTDLIDEFSELGGKGAEWAEQMKTAITGISLEDLKSKFRSLLGDMKSDSKDFAKSFEEIMNNAMLNWMSQNYDKKLEDWRNKLNDAMSDGKISASEKQALDRLQKEITESALNERKALEEAGYLNDMEKYEQNFSKGVGNMQEETAEEMNGRLTAIAYTAEIIRANGVERFNQLSLLNTSLSQIMEMTSGRGVFYETVTEQIAQTYIELQGIHADTTDMRANMRELYSEMNRMRRTIEEKL